MFVLQPLAAYLILKRLVVSRFIYKNYTLGPPFYWKVEAANSPDLARGERRL